MPATDKTTITTYVDDTTLLAANNYPMVASRHLQHHLNLQQQWYSKWKIKINQTKSVQVTFTTRRINCPKFSINSIKIPVKTDAKYLGLYLDQKLRWQKHVETKRQKLNLRLREMSWLLGRKSKLSIENKLLLYKCIIEPVWTYGIQLWDCTKPPKTKIIKRFQSKFLRLITNAPWYVSKLTLHNDLQIPFVIEDIHRLSTLYRQSVLGHNNRVVAENSNPPNARGRLRRQRLSDLPQPVDEKS
jgi:hypothetical protein